MSVVAEVSPPNIPSRQTLLERAERLSAEFAARAVETNKLRRLPDENVRAMQEAGFFRILQPSRYGGYEHDPQVFFDVQMTIAKGCPSSAWVLGVVAVHAWQLALFDPQAQEDVWGEDSSVLISSSYAPVGKIARAEGGWIVNGRWSFSSGSDHCDWVFLGGFCPVEEGQRPDMRTFLIPKGDYRIEDTWHTSGLQGTGSNDVVVEDAFVPEHRTHRFNDGYRCASPGNEVNSAPLYRIPFGQIFVRSVSTTAIGIAQGALDTYVSTTRARIATADGSKAADDPSRQIVVAQSAATIDALKLVIRRNFDEMMDYARRGEKIPVEKRVEWRYHSSDVVPKCIEVVDNLMDQSGGRAIFLNNPINRYFQDIHAARAHYANNPDSPGRNFGRVALGMRNKDYFI